MYFCQTFRYFWWVFLIIISAIFVYSRWADILVGKVSAVDTVILGILGALLLIPLFSEMTLLGVSLKQELDKTKKEISKDIREQLISFSSSVNVHNYLAGQPPQNDELPVLTKQLDEEVAEQKVEKEIPVVSVPKIAEIAFQCRFNIEKVIREIWMASYKKSVAELRRKTVRSMLDDLKRDGIVTEKVDGYIMDIIAISNYAIHGEQVTEEQISFIQDATPKVLVLLELTRDTK